MASKQSALVMNKQYPTSPVENYVPSSPQYIPDPDMPVEPWHVKPQVPSSSKEGQSSYGQQPTPPVFPAQPPTPPVFPAQPPTPPESPTQPPTQPVLPAPPPAPPTSPTPPGNLPNQLEEGECVDTSEEEAEEEDEAPADPWNDTAFDLEAKLLNLDEEGFPKENSRRGHVDKMNLIIHYIHNIHGIKIEQLYIIYITTNT